MASAIMIRVSPDDHKRIRKAVYASRAKSLQQFALLAILDAVDRWAPCPSPAVAEAATDIEPNEDCRAMMPPRPQEPPGS